jgi:hypothetical protein
VAVLATLARRWAARALGGARALRLIAPGLLFLGSLSGFAQATPSREYQIKAVFLFNFAQFVEWPPAAFSQDTTPLVIGILGDDPFGSYLDEIVHGEEVNHRPLTVQRYRHVEDVKACHVLFVSRSEGKNLEKTLAGLKGLSVLTVGDADGFATRGGMIQLTTEQGKIRLRINVDAVRASKLTISSKLLRSADIISTGSN